uniref:Uncharacterized protein n=1 Tax=Arundo donax TaxID=35708 RepID=A0A0A9HDP9_ARUDO
MPQPKLLKPLDITEANLRTDSYTSWLKHKNIVFLSTAVKTWLKYTNSGTHHSLTNDDNL